MSWLNTTVKQELVTPAMLSFLYSKVLQLYRHNRKKKKLQKSETENGKKATLPDILHERQNHCSEKILYFMGKHTIVKTKVFHQVGQAADPILCVTPVK